MDKPEVYRQLLAALEANAKGLRAMLPDEMWGDEPLYEEKAEIELIEEVINNISAMSLPYSRPIPNKNMGG